MLRALESMYGPPNPPRVRRGAALDALVEAMLAQNTNMINAARGYRMLRRRFDSWAKVMNAPLADVQREIAVCGLARMRARRLQNILRTIKGQRGTLWLDFLADQTPDEAFDYLMGFYGVGPKTAAFTLLYGCGHAILPVDNGVLRVVRRLRLVRAKARDLEAERVLSPLIDAGRHHAAHALLFRHAGQRCRPRNPKCHECDLLKLCPHGRRVVRHRPPEAQVAPPPSRRRAVPLARYISAGISKLGDPSERE
jgi:endonuclease-3